jgi:C4-dicarboxylate transporter
MFEYLITLIFLVLMTYVYIQWYPVVFVAGVTFIVLVIVSKALKNLGYLSKSNKTER